MLRTAKDLHGYVIRATDGLIGHVDEVYFDDDDWTIRYFVVDTGGWLSGRMVLISPLAIGSPDWIRQELPLTLTRATVEHSPDIDTKKPVSRQHEAKHLGYFGYPYYWGSTGVWGLGAYPGSVTREGRVVEQMRKRRFTPSPQPEDCHLRSSRAVIGYHIQATDGEIGHVQDLLIDDHTWTIRYLIVDTSNWWLGHQMLVAPPWIEAVNWSQANVSVNLTRQAIKDAPPYDSTAQLDRQREQAIYDHYGHRTYWTTTSTQDDAHVTK